MDNLGIGADSVASEQHEGYAPLVDVSDMKIMDLLGAEDSVFRRALKRLLKSLDDPDGIISAFQSFASD